MSRTATERERIAAQLKDVEKQVPSDSVGAAQHHAVACEAGTVGSCLALARLFERGEGVKVKE